MAGNVRVNVITEGNDIGNVVLKKGMVVKFEKHYGIVTAQTTGGYTVTDLTLTLGNYWDTGFNAGTTVEKYNQQFGSNITEVYTDFTINLDLRKER